MRRGVGKTLPCAITILIAIAAADCGSSTSTSVTGPTAARCQVSVTSSASSFGPAGGSGTLSVGVSRECTWSASTQAAWITLTSTHDGQGEGTVTYKVAENADPVTRRGAIAVGDQQAELSQDAAPCRFQVIPPAQSVAPGGGQMGVELRTNALCPWTAASESTFATVAPPSGKGNAIVSVTVAPNPGSSRAASVVIAGERLAITQPASTPVPGPAPTANPTPNPPAPAPPTPVPPPTSGPTPPAPAPVPVRAIELEGKIDSVSGSCPRVSFELKHRTVVVSPSTAFVDGSCKTLDRHVKVRVKGREMSDDTIQADQVTFDE